MASKNDPCDPFPNYVSCEIHLMMVRASMPAKRVGNFEVNHPVVLWRKTVDRRKKGALIIMLYLFLLCVFNSPPKSLALGNRT